MNLLLALLACGADDADSAAPVPDFADLEADIFVPSCAFSFCHGGGTGGLELDGAGDHAALVGVPSTGMSGATLVIAGDAEGSYLVHKVEGRASIAGEPMPAPNGLDADAVAALRAWIDAGAAP